MLLRRAQELLKPHGVVAVEKADDSVFGQAANFYPAGHCVHVIILYSTICALNFDNDGLLEAVDAY